MPEPKQWIEIIGGLVALLVLVWRPLRGLYLTLLLLQVQRIDFSLAMAIGSMRPAELVASASLAMLVIGRFGIIWPSWKTGRMMWVWIGLFVAAMWASSFASRSIGNYSLHYIDVRTPARMQPFIASYTAILVYLFGMSAFFLVSQLVQSRARLRAVLRWWVIGAALASAVAMYGGIAYQFHLPFGDVLSPLGRTGLNDGVSIGVLPRLRGLAQEPRMLAVYLTAVLPFVLLATIRKVYVLPRLWQRLCLLLIGLGFVGTFSRATLLAAVCIAVLFAVVPVIARCRHVRVARSVVVALVLVVGLGVLSDTVLRRVFNVAGIGAAVQSQVESLTVDDSSTVTWPQQQRMAWHMFLDHPILGIGLGNFTFFVDRYSEMNAEEYARGYHYIANTDSIYTSVLAEMGLLGFFTFIGLVTYPAWVVIRDARHVDREDQIILVGLVTGYVAVLMVYAAQGLFFFAHVWAAMGILYSAWRVTIRLKRATPDTIGTTPFATSASASTAETRPMLSLSTTKHRAIQ